MLLCLIYRRLRNKTNNGLGIINDYEMVDDSQNVDDKIPVSESPVKMTTAESDKFHDQPETEMKSTESTCTVKNSSYETGIEHKI